MLRFHFLVVLSREPVREGLDSILSGWENDRCECVPFVTEGIAEMLVGSFLPSYVNGVGCEVRDNKSYIPDGRHVHCILL